MKNRNKILYIALFAVVVCCAFAFVYLNDYYPADAEAVAAFSSEACDVQAISDSLTAFVPENAKTGLIFYPGGKVECSAYEPLMLFCAEHGILCVLVEMPFNLAVFDMDAANGIQENFPEIDSWYIAGHSLGGAMAASYLAEKPGDYKGLILLASYSTADLSSSGLEVLSIYGSEDAVMNREKYNESLSNMPADFTELVIEGGNHAGFGMYGAQKGDGTALISCEEQINITVKTISEFIFNKK